MIEAEKNGNYQDARQIRAYTMIDNGIAPITVNDNTFTVQSQNGENHYTVAKKRNDKYSCTCPDYEKRDVVCKHIRVVLTWQKLKEKLGGVETVTPPKNDVSCKFCNSKHLIKYGKSGQKQVYKCRNCDRKFVEDDGFSNLKYEPNMISMCLDLYFKGVSLRKISNHIEQFHRIKIDHSTVYRWIEKYVGMISEYVNTLSPELSEKWHHDEMMVKVDGDWHWLWNIMDNETRFQLVSEMTRLRRQDDAKRIFIKAKKVGGKKPKEFVTDGLTLYRGAFNKVFYDHHKSCKHVVAKGIRYQPNNNIVERLNNTIRDREKTMRGLKIKDTPMVEGHRIAYNFVRPHEALEGKTPAEMAGLGLNLGDNKWLGLMKKATEI